MSESAHIIEIERIVLHGIDRRDVMKARALVEAEVHRALQGLPFPVARALTGRENAVAAEVASSVSDVLKRGTRDA